MNWLSYCVFQSSYNGNYRSILKIELSFRLVSWVGYVWFFFLPRMSGWECQISGDCYPSLSFLQTSWPVATEVSAGCISLPECFQLVKSGFPDISWLVCSVLQQDYTCAAVKCEIRAEQDLP